MPAMLDDPMSPTIYRTSGVLPYPDPHDPHPALPEDIRPRQVTLRDRVTIATILPFSSRNQIPPSLLAYLSDQLNKEIEGGDTYPMIDPLSYEKFASYWFQNFGAVMLLGDVERAEDVVHDWSAACLGSFYIKPNYPGRSSHVCNAGFLVTDAARNRGVGRLMGETYIDWAPKLGYTYSVFNLVYETSVASCRIWDALGFKRIGRVKGCGNLKSYPGQLIDAIIYGRDLGPEGDDLVSEERFDKIKFYLKFGKYPNGADRAEKSRLRSAATHYKVLDGDKLMLKDKEVISDPKSQYEIARKVHVVQHGGINKTTATIAESYHWIRIKETVSLVIRNCEVCKEMGKVPVVRADGVTAKRASGTMHGQGGVSAVGRLISLPSIPDPDSHSPHEQYGDPFHSASASHLGSSSVLSHPLDHSPERPMHHQDHHLQHEQQHRHPHQLQHHHSGHTAPTAVQMHHQHNPNPTDEYIALDPQIMEDVRHHLGHYIDHDHDQDHDHDPSQHSSYNNPFQGMSMLSAHSISQHTRQPDHGPGEEVSHADLDMLIDDDPHDGDSGDQSEGDVEAGGTDLAEEEMKRRREREREHAQIAARAVEAAMGMSMRGELDGNGKTGTGPGAGGGLYASGSGYRDG
jgi:GNAT superfamily N-acetyltransferase